MRACNQFTVLLFLAVSASCQLYIGHLIEKSWLSEPLISVVNQNSVDSGGLCIVLSYYIIALNTYCLPGTQLFAILAGTKFGFYEAVLLGSRDA